MKNKYIIDEANAGVRLDKCLVELSLNQHTRAYFSHLIDENAVTVNGKVEKASYRLRLNDVVEFEITEPKPLKVEAEDIPLDIIYEDEDIIVINKPSGMVVHPSNGHYDGGTLVNALLAHCHDLSGINGVIRPGIVHRIDKDTSGLLVVAKNDFAHEYLAKQLKDKSMHREYIALVKGIIKEDDAKIIAPIGRDKTNRLKMGVDVQFGKDAVTHVHVLERFNQHTLISCLLETGRTHQIRVHLSHIGYPIEGDLMYGTRKNSLYDKGQLLHAYKLVLIHPRSEKKMEFTCPLPDYFEKIIKKLKNIN